MKTSLIPAALVTLALGACGEPAPPPVTSSRELPEGPERADAVRRAMAEVLSRGVLSGGEDVEALTARAVLQDSDGTEHVRLDRAFRGMRVIGGDLVAHQRAEGTPVFQLAGHAELRAVARVPLVVPEEAVRQATSAFVGRLGGLEGSELVVDARPGLAPELAHEVVLRGTQPDGTPSRLHVLVDAVTGERRGQWEDFHTASAQGTGASLYSGAVTLSTTPALLGGFELRDSTRGAGFYTTDMKNGEDLLLPLPIPILTTGTVFKDADNVWGNGLVTDRQSAAVDAHFGQQITYDYFQQVHGRDGIDGKGKTGFSRVHYGKGYNNAFWTDLCFCMTYGDGDGQVLSPLTSLDVAGHEMTHGVTSRTANLTYAGESGGLNEATSDIFGSLVEFHANTPADPGDYLIGETIFTPGTPGDALRYMHQPSLDGRSPDCWSSTLASLDVHYSSGVGNHFFYLLAEGSQPATGPASPTCDGASLTGIGRQKAGKIWYRALTVYMTSSTTYADARVATLNAARDLYGAGGAEHAAVAAAWTSVSVN